MNCVKFFQNHLIVVRLTSVVVSSHTRWCPWDSSYQDHTGNGRKLDLPQCYIGDHGMSIIHQYLCGDETNKQEITEINLAINNLTGASSHLIADRVK